MTRHIADQCRAERPVAQSGQGFIASESGSLTVFALCLFVLMVLIGGVAVDLMRYETTRTSLQNTLDRSTLAAASLSQTLDAEDVVTDYFEKAGLLQNLNGVVVDEGLNYREVTADASASTDPLFMHMLGIDEFDAPGHSKAEQRMNNVEVVLVLDVSGSMGSNSRLVNLKVAAKEFVDTLLSSDEEDRISISIVPFSENVNLGADLRSKYNATYVHGVANVNCLELPSTAFSSTGVSLTDPIPMVPAADLANSTNKTSTYVGANDSNYANPVSNDWPCTAKAQNTVVLPSQNIAALQARIDGLTADSMTSINLGMKWGMAMLDPGTRSAFTALSTAGKIPAAFEGRPFDYTDPESMKVVILMTDGENTTGDLMEDAWKAGDSPVFKSPYDGYYSIQFTSGRPASAGSNQFWVPHYYNSSTGTYGAWRAKAWTNSTNTGDAIPVQWQELWADVRLTWAVWNLYARAIGTNSSQRGAQYNTWYAAIHSATVPATMNTQLQTVCNLAKTNGVTVYGIAFEAPSNGRTAISNCATSSAHYFNASGLQIRTAFRAIANNISHLRLTQ